MSCENDNCNNKVNFRNEEEQMILDKFKEAVSHLEKDELILIRFLRAREHNLEKAEDMLRQCITWRANNDISTYYSWKPPTFLKDDYKILFRVTGNDHNGHPVFFLPIGSYLARECIEDGHKEDIFKFCYNLLENVLHSIKESTESQVVAILGIENLKFRTVMHLETLQTLHRCFQILEQNYPEVLKSLMVINAPWMFSIAFNFIKPILSAYTISKLEIHDSNRSKWMPRLLEVMPMDSVPEEYMED